MAQRAWKTVITLLALVAAAMPARAETAPTPFVVSGPAGSMANVVFTTTVQFGEQDVNTVSDSGGWGGVVIVADEGAARDRHHLVDVTLSQELRCPGTSCPYTVASEPQFGHFEEGIPGVVLAPGRYHVVLAGPAGAQVTTTITPEGASGPIAHVLAADRPTSYVASRTDGQGAPGREALLHAFDAVPPSGQWGVAAAFTPYAIMPAGALADVRCSTVGGNDMAAESAGGVGPCLDFKGSDVISDDAGPAGFEPAPSIAPVQVLASSIHGQSDERFGLGIDMAVAGGTATFLRSVFIGVTVD